MIRQNAEINQRQLKDELDKAQRRYIKHSENWLGNEILGRVLYWMGNPEAATYFEKAAHLRIATLKPDKTQSWDILAIGNYFRMAGKLELSQNYFARAYEIFTNEVGDINNLDGVRFHSMHGLIIACFLHSDYKQTVAYGQVLRKNDPDFRPDLLSTQIALLAEAKIAGSVTAVQYIIDTTFSYIRKDRTKIQATGSFTLWDLYGLALETLEEIEIDNKKGQSKSSEI